MFSMETSESASLNSRNDVDGRRLLAEIKDGPAADAVSLARQAISRDDEGLYTAAEKLYKEALDRCNELDLDECHQLRLFCMNKRTAALTNQGRYREAKNISHETFNLVRKHFSTCDDSYRSCAANRAHLFRCLGEVEAASNVAFGTVDRSDVYPLDTMVGTNLFSVIARIHRDCKEYLDCELVSQNVVQASHKHVGSYHRFTFNSESELAVAMAWQGKFGIAEKVARRAHEGLGRIVGARHPWTLRAGRRLAECLIIQRRGYEAQPLLEATLEAQKMHFGYNHLGTISTLERLGLVYETFDDKTTANKIFLKASKLRDYLQSINHLDDATVKSSNGKSELTGNDMPRGKVDSFSEEERVLTINPDWKILGYNVADEDTFSKASQGHRFEDSYLVGNLVRFSAAKGDTNLLKTLLDVYGHESLRAEGGLWGTALSAACCKDQENTVDELLERGIDPNARRGGALRISAFKGNLSIVERLTGRGAKVSPVDSILGSPLLAALAGGHTDIVKHIVDKLKNGRDVNPLPEDASLEHPLFGTPLQRAALEGNKRLVNLLVDDFEANPDKVRGFFGPALQLAALENHSSICKKLVGLEPPMDTLEQALRDAMAAHCNESVQVLLQAVRKKRQVEGSKNDEGPEPRSQHSAVEATKNTDNRVPYEDKAPAAVSLPPTKMSPPTKLSRSTKFLRAFGRKRS